MKKTISSEVGSNTRASVDAIGADELYQQLRYVNALWCPLFSTARLLVHNIVQNMVLKLGNLAGIEHAC